MKHNLFTPTLISLGLAASFNTCAVTADENIVVTANRTQQDQFLSLSATQIIDADDIQAFQPLSVTDLLDKVAGISVTNQGDAGHSSSVFTRGTNNGHTLVLIDGVRISSATLGSTSFSSLSVTQIERIEVVKGPRAALWGADAIGGVIQIFTKKLVAGEAVVSVGFGSNGLKQADAAIGFGNEQHALTLSIAKQEADGFNATTIAGQEDDDRYDRTSVSLTGQSELTDELVLSLASRYEEGGSDYDSPWGGTPSDEFENYHVKLAADYTTGDWYSQVSVATSENASLNFSDGFLTSEYTTKRDQVGVLVQYQAAKNTSITGGSDWYQEEVIGTGGYDVDQRDVTAFFVQARHQLDQVYFEAAVRRDDIEDVAAQTTYNASVGYQINDELLVSLSRGTAFKAPSFNDLYYPEAWGYAGNVDVMPESVVTNELLIRQKLNGGQVEISLFESTVDDLIDWQFNSDTGLTQPTNVTAAKIKGAEVTLSTQTGDFNHQVVVSYIDAKDEVLDVDLARRPQLSASYALSYQWQDLTLSGSASYRDESVDLTMVDANILDDHWLVDLSANYQVTDNLVLITKINNLFDEEYQTAKDYVADGTNFVISASYSF